MKKTPQRPHSAPARAISGSQPIPQAITHDGQSEQAVTSGSKILRDLLAGRDAQLAKLRIMLQEIQHAPTLERARIIAAGALALADSKSTITIGALERVKRSAS